MIPTVVHLVTPYLFPTGTWIYSQLQGITEYRSVVFTQRTVTTGQFPWPHVYAPESFPTWKQAVNKVVRRTTGTYGLFFGPAVDAVKPSVFHGHMGYESVRWLEFVRRTGLPLVTTFYGHDVSEFGRRPEWRRRYARLFEHGRLFLAEGTNLGRQLSALGCPTDKIVVQHLGVPIDRYAPRTDEGIVRDRPIVITQAASFREKKGVLYSLQAVAGLLSTGRKVRFRLIGAGDPVATAEVRTAIDRLGIGRDVDMVGAVGHAAMLEELRNSDIFLHPSVTAANGDNEGGAPVAIIEASAMGVPVVSTFHADIPEVVVDGTTGLLAPEREVEGLVTALLRLTDDPALRSSMGRAGRDHVRREYDLVTQMRKLQAIYTSVAA